MLGQSGRAVGHHRGGVADAGVGEETNGPTKLRHPETDLHISPYGARHHSPYADKSTISVEGVRYSVPHDLIDSRVRARFHGDELIVTAVDEDGSAREAARHSRGPPGTPVLEDDHYPPRKDKEGDRTPKATSAEEAAFLALGPGAASWLIEAAATGVRRVKAKMAEAIALSKLYSMEDVDRALGTAAVTGRFADKDLLSIIDYQATREHTEPVRRSEEHSLQPGTSAWSSFGLPATTSDISEYDESDHS